ncbi:cytochrome c family protein [bacterium]|nr:cytochrome c family protein [bacterium]
MSIKVEEDKTTGGKYIFAGILLLAGLMIIVIFVKGGNNNAVQQPINFLHQTHVALNDLTCEFCHIYARRSEVSGVPPVSVCTGCHLHLKGTVSPQSNEIRKIIELHWNKGKPIAWKKIHDLPDFISFSHEVHISAGFDCTNCHGDLMKTKTPEPFILDGQTPQSMGWCLTCHVNPHPTYKGKILGPIRATRGASVFEEQTTKADGFLTGSRDCVTCHK